MSQWEDDPDILIMDIFNGGLAQPSQPTEPPTEEQCDLLEYMLNVPKVNEWRVRLSQLKVDAAEGKIITGWMQTAVDRRARAMKCFAELEKIMREQEQAYDEDFDVSFPPLPLPWDKQEPLRLCIRDAAVRVKDCYQEYDDAKVKTTNLESDVGDDGHVVARVLLRRKPPANRRRLQHPRRPDPRGVKDVVNRPAKLSVCARHRRL